MLSYVGTKDHYKYYIDEFEDDDGGVMNPLQFDNVWTLVSFGDLGLDVDVSSMSDFNTYLIKKYDFEGNVSDLLDDCQANNVPEDEFFDKLHAYLKKFGIFSEPISVYEHDNVELSRGVASGWDSGVEAIAIVDRKQLRWVYETKQVTKKIIKTAYQDLDNELSNINDDNNGCLDTIIVKDQDGDEADRSCQFYGSEYDDAKDKLKFVSTNFGTLVKPYSEYKKQKRVDNLKGMKSERKQLKNKLKNLNQRITKIEKKI